MTLLGELPNHASLRCTDELQTSLNCFLSIGAPTSRSVAVLHN